MSQVEHDKKVQERAYEIWEAEGRPHGRHEQHWQDALKEVAATASSAVATVTKAVRRTTKKVAAALTPASGEPTAPPSPLVTKPKRAAKPRSSKASPAVSDAPAVVTSVAPSPAAAPVKRRPRVAKTGPKVQTP